MMGGAVPCALCREAVPASRCRAASDVAIPAPTPTSRAARFVLVSYYNAPVYLIAS